MEKKKIKRRVTKNTTTTRSNSNNNNNKKIKTKVSQPTKNNITLKVIMLVIFIALILFCYFALNLTFAIIVTIVIGIIVGIIELLKKVGKKRKVIKILLIIILACGILGLSAFAGFLVYIKAKADPMFVTSKLETPENTTLLDIEGREYAKLGSEIREKIKYNELPEVLVDAIVATEDSRFFQHNGFDAPRFIKAAIGQVARKLFHVGSNAGGASTLSMQVVKNSLTDARATEGAEGIIRKFKDIYLAVFKLEKKYTKEEIIEYYVNNHYLGGNVYGVQEASEAYFGKTVSELNLSEAAILAGMFKSPRAYRPTDHPENAEKRRNTVLYLMRKHGYITEEEEKMAKAIPVESLVSDNTSSVNSQYQGYIDTVVNEIEKKYKVNAYTTPLLVYTNLDRSKQDGVNKVFNGETYSWINDKVQAGVSVLDSQTGKILAIGNGRNIGTRTAGGIKQYNYATSIKRQPGSTAKPLFDYGPGIEYNNWSTYTLFDDEPYTYTSGQKINNWDGNYFGTITLRKALSTSRNIPALKAFQQVDNKKIIEFVTNLGMQPEIEGGKIHEAHSIGAFTGTNPLQMSAAYAAFSNGGYYNEPYSVSKIVFKSTNEVKEHKSEKKQVMSDATAFMISSVLQDVSLSGSGNIDNIARKTGTTNYDAQTMIDKGLPGDAVRDSWVVGYSTKTVIGMWYGYDFIDSEYCLRNIPATIQKDKLFRALVSSGAMESDRTPFVQPESVVKVGIEMGSNPAKLASPNSSNVVYEYFKKDYVPEETYEEQKIDKPDKFKVSYDETTKKVSMSWDAVNKPTINEKNPGTFGYNIYLDNTLIAFTDKTSYTYTPKASPYGTYKIIATFKGYSGIQSEPATYTLKEQVVEEEFDITKYQLVYNGKTTIAANSTLMININNFEVKNSKEKLNIKFKHCNLTQVTAAGKYPITCTIEYNKKEYDISMTLEITEEDTEEPEITE